ncbi:hypothetical protein ACF09Z_00550 [Streptomyces erythrochromogenes]|uniref:hypothetical protein n=1 Tax=Streptomyces erythrochromogenes TaxID=285574 RepID=UPI0037014DBD
MDVVVVLRPPVDGKGVDPLVGHLQLTRARLPRPGEVRDLLPPVDVPDLYLHLLVTRMRRRQLSMAALAADAQAEAARCGARLLRTHCWAGEDGRLVREYEELGFTATLEFEVLRSDGSFWPGQVLQFRL